MCNSTLLCVFCAGQPECAYYLRHARCGFGPSCKFHHPEPGTSGGPQDFQPDPQPAPTSLLGGPQSDPSISYTATGIPAPATATGIPASAVTGIPVSTMGVDVPATSMQDVAQGVPVPEAGLHADQAKNLPAQADASLSQPQFIISSSPPQPLTQSAATLLQPASVAYPGMHMTAAVPTLPVTALQLAALQQPQGQVPSVSVPLQAAVVTAAQSSAVPSVSASAEEAQHAQKAQHAQQTQQEAQQTQQAQQAQQSQQAQQGLQQQSTVLAPSAPMQSWPQSANIAAAPTAMYAQAGTMPVLQASTAVAGAQLPAQQLASNGVQQPTAVPSPQLPVQQVEPIAVQPASTIMASGPQVMYGSQPAQVAQAAPSNGMLEVPTGEPTPHLQTGG